MTGSILKIILSLSFPFKPGQNQDAEHGSEECQAAPDEKSSAPSKDTHGEEDEEEAVVYDTAL